MPDKKFQAWRMMWIPDKKSREWQKKYVTPEWFCEGSTVFKVLAKFSWILVLHFLVFHLLACSGVEDIFLSSICI